MSSPGGLLSPGINCLGHVCHGCAGPWSPGIGGGSSLVPRPWHWPGSRWYRGKTSLFAVFCSNGVVLTAGGWLCLVHPCALEWEWGASGLYLMACLDQEGCAIPFTGVTASVVYWPNDSGWQPAAAPSRLVPHRCGLAGGRAAMGQPVGALAASPVPSSCETNSVGTSSCTCLSQSRVSPRFWGLQ